MKNETNKNTKKKKYRTHPIIKASVSLFLLTSILSSFAAYLFYRYSVTVAEEYEAKIAAVRHEAYLEFCEKITETDGAGAAAALSRYVLFSDKDDEVRDRAEVISNYLLNGSFSEKDSEEIYSILSEYGNDEAGAMNKTAEVLYDRVHDRGVILTGSSGEEWSVLREKAEVSADEAREVARRFIGGGVTLTMSESHTFPLVYVFSCENAVAEVSRMGGRLISMWRYPLGNLNERTVAACRLAAREFVYEAGITGAYIINEEVMADEVRFTFCGVSRVGDEEAVFADEKIEVAVARGGARIVGFDAAEYYRWRGGVYDKKKIAVSRARAMEILGDGGEIKLTASHGELFWGLYEKGDVTGNVTKNGSGGVKNHYISAETGDFTVKNP